MKVSYAVRFAGRARKRDEKAGAPAVVPSSTGPSAIARRIALGHYLARCLGDGTIESQGAAANLLGVSRARVTQLIDLSLLGPAVQEAVLVGRVAPTDRQLRLLGSCVGWQEQEEAFGREFRDAN